MTCPVCGRRVRALAISAVKAHRITPSAATRIYIDSLKEYDMPHLTLIISPTFGDIGEDQEEWEVIPVPTEVPAEVPAPSEPVPA